MSSSRAEVGQRSRTAKVGEIRCFKPLAIAPFLPGCDEYIESYGGRISLDGQKHLLNTYIDCVWVIARFPAILRNFDRIYLKVQRGVRQN